MHKEEDQVAESCAESQLPQRDAVMSEYALCNGVIVTDEYYVTMLSKMMGDNARLVDRYVDWSYRSIDRYILMNTWMEDILLWKRKVQDMCVDNFCLQLEHKRDRKIRIVEEQTSDRTIETWN